jgi:protein dithiol oxidoreductase (disulfide-forming)
MKNAVILALSLLVFSAQAQSPATVPVAGKDYVEIPNGRPLEPEQGVVVIEEFFNYICPACNMFEPTFVKWAAELPAYAKVHHVPASFRPDFVQYARAYYAAETFGIAEKTHQAVYDAIHRQHVIPAEGDRPDEEKIAKFYAGYGVDEQQFLAAMRSFGVDAKVRRANEQMTRNKIPSTPSVVVNGRYLVRGTTYADTLRIASYLIEEERGS